MLSVLSDVVFDHRESKQYLQKIKQDQVKGRF